jgi:hypothetical protein
MGILWLRACCLAALMLGSHVFRILALTLGRGKVFLLVNVLASSKASATCQNRRSENHNAQIATRYEWKGGYDTMRFEAETSLF